MNAKLNSASVKYQTAKDAKSRSILERILSIVLMGMPATVVLSAVFLPLIATPAAQAVPLPKDWCGRIWGLQTPNAANPVFGWDNPTTGASSNTAPPGVAPIPSLTGGSYAALGLHARSGTLYTLDRNSSSISYYSMGATTPSWQNFPTSIPTIITNTNAANGPVGSATITYNGYTTTNTANTNFNKMTVTGNLLLVASSDSLRLFTFNIDPATGALSGGAAANIGFDNNTLLPNGTRGNPPGTGAGIAAPAATIGGTNYPALTAANNNPAIGGGDIAQDEYGDTYMMTYDNAAANTPTQYVYFYKLVSGTWVYKDRVTKVPVSGNTAEQFAGFAIYADVFYVKGAGIGGAGVSTLYELPLTRTTVATNSEYNWSTNNASLVAKGGSGTAITDLATCGVPSINVTKTQSIYTDAAGNTLTPDQTRTATGQYIKYTITGTNVGDAWAKDAYMNDDLPPGVEYVPNTATINGANINAATYPFATASNLAATSPGSTTGQIRLPLLGNTNVVTYTFIVRVTGTAPTVSNQARIGYLNPYPADPPNCTTGLNCGTTALATLYPSIFGTVWNDKNGSAAGTFSNIFTTGEVGTNTGAANALYALLVNSAGNVVATAPIASDGTYAFQALNTNQNGLTIRLSTTAGTVGSAAPTAAIPTGWKGTSPKATTTFNLTTADISNQDFGISLPAGIVLVKRITGIKPVGSSTFSRTTNPNDGTPLNTVVHNPLDLANNDTNPNWPAGYLVGAYNAGKIRPGDEIEYRIYYLNAKGADTKNLKICDPIRGKQAYVASSMKLQPGGVSTISLTDAIDPTVDRGNSYAAGTVPTNCNAANTTATGIDRGGVAIGITGTGASAEPDLTVLPSATGSGTPAASYGWFQFVTKVDP